MDETERKFYNGSAPYLSVAEVSGDQTFVKVEGLVPYTLYGCSVTATTSAGEGDGSVVISARTDESGNCSYYL